MNSIKWTFLLFCICPWTAYAQVASQALAPSVQNLLPAAAGFSRLNGSGEPDQKQTGFFGVSQISGGGAAGDDANNWNTKGYSSYFGATFGPLSMDLRATEKTTQLTRILGGTMCGQIDKIVNCGASTLDSSRKQTYQHQHLDLALVWSLLSIGVRVGSEKTFLESQGTLNRSQQGASVSLQLLGGIYLSSGAIISKETPPGYASYQWTQTLSAIGASFGDESRVHVEASTGKSEKQTSTSAQSTRYWVHSADKQTNLTAELKWGQVMLGLDQHRIEIPSISNVDAEPKATVIKGIRMTWAYPMAFDFTIKRDSEIYSIGTIGDNTQEGKLTTMSLGGTF